MILVNGQCADSVSVLDRGLAYGDGIFRTLFTRAGQPLWWRDHYAKLVADCAALDLKCPEAAELLLDVCRVAEAEEGVVKVILTRGPGARGYAPPASPACTRVVMASLLPPHAQTGTMIAVAARWCALRLAPQPRLAGIKHLNRLENVMARSEWDDPAIFEGLLRDNNGWVIGGVMSNLFWAKDGELFTPDLSQCGVAGVARARLLRGAALRGIRSNIGRFQPDAILAADEVMLCNSVMGVRRVARLDEIDCPSAGWTDIVKSILYEDVD